MQLQNGQGQSQNNSYTEVDQVLWIANEGGAGQDQGQGQNHSLAEINQVCVIANNRAGGLGQGHHCQAETGQAYVIASNRVPGTKKDPFQTKGKDLQVLVQKEQKQY